MTEPKWKFAIGTTSIVPKTHRELHYLICDVDQDDAGAALDFIMSNIEIYRDMAKPIEVRVQQTKRGWHIFTNIQFTFKDCLYWLRHTPGVDRAWIEIGANRGYWFLADKDEMRLPWNVKRMCIHYEKNSKKET